MYDLVECKSQEILLFKVKIMLYFSQPWNLGKSFLNQENVTDLSDHTSDAGITWSLLSYFCRLEKQLQP